MKYFLVCVFVILLNPLYAQESKKRSLIQITSPTIYNDIDISENLNIKEITSGTKVLAVNTGGGYFYRSYLINKEGESISNGFMPQAYFMPNDNFLVITAQGHMAKDAFNPYGAYDMPSMLILGTMNNFISKFSRIKR